MTAAVSAGSPGTAFKNIASTAVVIYGLIGAMSTMYAEHIDPEAAFKVLGTEDGEGDIFAWETRSGSGPASLRRLVPTRAL